MDLNNNERGPLGYAGLIMQDRGLSYDEARAFLHERVAARIIRHQGCWYWSGQHNAVGRPVLRVLANRPNANCQLRRTLRAARLIYELTYGAVPSGLMVRHRCDNAKCVRLDHLELGTGADNMQDKLRRNILAGFSEAQVRAIRLDLTPSSLLAKKFGVSRKTIADVRRGATYQLYPFTKTERAAQRNRRFIQYGGRVLGADLPCLT